MLFMNSKDFLAKQLGETAQIIDWAIKLVPETRLLEIHPAKDHPKADEFMKRYFGSWSAYRILFHLVIYEEVFALPALKHWLGGPLPRKDKVPKEEELWNEELQRGIYLKALLKRFHAVRKEQIEALNQMSEATWKEVKDGTFWGKVSAEFSVSKTIQHSFEHGNKIMRLGLFWDRLLAWLDQLEKLES